MQTIKKKPAEFSNETIAIQQLSKQAQQQLGFVASNAITGVTLTPVQTIEHCLEMVSQKLNFAIDDYNKWIESEERFSKSQEFLSRHEKEFEENLPVQIGEKKKKAVH